MFNTDLSVAAYRSTLSNLRSLLIIRALALLGQTGVLAYALHTDRATGELYGLVSSMVMLALVTLASAWRCQLQWPVTDAEFLAQLMLDVSMWTALMYFSGGADNPFVSYYIVPVVVSAAVLPWRYTWVVTLASLAAYSMLLYIYVPFPLFTPTRSIAHGGSSVHTLGMWFNFLFSASLITFFVVRMRAMLNAQIERDAVKRENRLRNDQIMAVASLAAGTAHELGTPLGTMTLTVDELLQDQSLSDEARADCEVLRGQLNACRDILRSLSHTAELSSIDQARPQSVREFADATLARWTVRRPGVAWSKRCDGQGEDAWIMVDSTLSQALENLLNNAADSGTDRVELSVDWNETEACISVRDWGSGIPPSLLDDPGKPVLLGSRKGLGIGLMLSHAAVERQGGHITLRNLEQGCEARLILPQV